MCLSVALKVIACNLKRWAKAYTASGNALKRLVWVILRHLSAFETHRNQLCFALRI